MRSFRDVVRYASFGAIVAVLFIVAMTHSRFVFALPPCSDPSSSACNASNAIFTGNVGIGTTNPGAKLHVIGSSLVENSSVTGYATFRGKADQVYGWELDAFGSGTKSDGSTYYAGPNGVALVNVNNAPLALGANNAGVLYITGAGNVGIGTTTPGAKLHVNGDIRISPYTSGQSTGYLNTPATLSILNGNIYNNSGSAAISRISFGGMYNPSGSAAVDAVYNYIDWSAGSLRIRNNQQDKIVVGAGDEWAQQNIYLNPTGGNVGIGTTSPSYQFDVRKADSTGVALIDINQDNATKLWTGTRLARQGTEKWFIGMDGTTDNLLLRSSGTTNAVTIDPSGNLTAKGDVCGAGGKCLSTVSSGGGQWALNGSNIVYMTGNVDVGTTDATAVAEHRMFIAKDVTYPNDVTNSQLSVGGASDARKELSIGYDTNGNGFGFIAAGYRAVTWTNLALQPNGGNVGIGGTSPMHKLHVVSSTDEDGMIIDTPRYPELRMDRSGTAKGYLGVAGSAGGYAGGTLADALVLRSENALHLVSNSGSYGPGLTLVGGKIGVGSVTAPSTAVDLPQNAAIKVGNAYLSSGGDYTHLANNEWYNGSAWTTNGSVGALLQLTGQTINFYKHDTAGGHTNLATLDSNGNFTAKGDVCGAGGKCLSNVGGGSTGYKILAGNSLNDGRTSGVWLWSPADRNHVMYSASPAGYSPAGNPAPAGYWTSGHRFRFRTYGALGGTAGQGFLWENSSEQKLMDLSADTGGLWIAGSLVQNSDERLKEDIQPLPNALAHVLQLRGVSYEWKNDPSKRPQIGVIAQDVEKVYPALVSTGTDGMKSVNYNGLTAPLIEAVKEQQQEIDTLKAEINQLKAAIRTQPQ